MYSYTFRLTRHSKPKQSLAKGNQLISANDRMHYAVKMKITEFLRNLSKTTLLKNKTWDKPVFNEDNPCTVTITIDPPTSRRMDPPNWYPSIKALIDGMTDAGLWTDDNKDVIKAMTFVYGSVSGDGTYHITIDVVPAK